MKRHIVVVVAVSAVLLLTAGAAAATPLVKFSGEGNGKTKEFSVEGPWLLDWKIESEFPDLFCAPENRFFRRISRCSLVIQIRPSGPTGY